MHVALQPKPTEPLAAALRRPLQRPLQRKTRIGPVDDPLEQEADRIADAVVAGRPFGGISGAKPGVAQPKCASCTMEEDRTLHRKEAAPTDAPSYAADAAAHAIAHGGMPLTPAQRSYFEPRFARDLSAIRIHTHGAAASAARAVNARAYALGHDIAFARGEYRPETSVGRHLIAHELAHALQQSAAGAAPVLRRATYGSGAPPAFATVTVGVVPEDERPHVDEALAKIDEAVADASTFKECHQNFADNCPGGNAGTLEALWNRLSIWRITSPDPGTLARAPVGGSDIAYTSSGYNQGTLGLAATLMHEAGHSCGIPGGSTHWHADRVSTYCMGPDSANAFSMAMGPGLSGGNPLWLFSYRRFLGDWAGGRLRATLGIDLNALGLGDEVASRDLPAGQRPTADIGSAMFGIQARAGGWGGTRYGGLSFRVETGIGVGRFSLRPATPDDAPSTALAPSWILQVGPKAEFLIPIGGGRTLPTSFGLVYRLAQPINEDARALHGMLGVIEFRP